MYTFHSNTILISRVITICNPGTKNCGLWKYVLHIFIGVIVKILPVPILVCQISKYLVWIYLWNQNINAWMKSHTIESEKICHVEHKTENRWTLSIYFCTEYIILSFTFLWNDQRYKTDPHRICSCCISSNLEIRKSDSLSNQLFQKKDTFVEGYETQTNIFIVSIAIPVWETQSSTHPHSLTVHLEKPKIN